MPRPKSNPFDIASVFEEPALAAPLPIAERTMGVPTRPYGNPAYVASFLDRPAKFPVLGSTIPGYRFACPLCCGSAELTYGHTADGPFHISCGGSCTGGELRRHLEALAPLAFEQRDDILYPMPPEMRDKVIAAAKDGVSLGAKERAAPILKRLRQGGGEVTFFDYTGPRGGTLLLLARVDYDDGAKRFQPVHCYVDASDQPHIECTFPEGPLPLYNWAQLAARPSDPVLVVEGEKTADAANRIFGEHYVATSSACGATNAALTDWSILHGRDVIIFRDNDEAGERYEKAAAAHAIAVGAASVRRVTPPTSLPEKWDLADPLPAELGIADLTGAIRNAVQVRWDEVKDAFASSQRSWVQPPFRLPDGLFEKRKVVREGIEAALVRLDSGRRRGRWLTIISAVHHALGESGFELADAWSRRDADKHNKYVEGEVRQLFEAYTAAPRANPTPLLTLFRMAMKESRESSAAEAWTPDGPALSYAYIAEFEARHRKISQGDNITIGIQTEAGSKYSIRHMSEKNAASLYLAKKAPGFDGQSTSVFKLWQHNQLLDPVELVFKPASEVAPGELNLFQGLKVQPVRGNGSYKLFREHLDRVAAANGDTSEFLWKLMAYRLQRLGEHVPCCLVLIGPEGGGKSTITSVIALLCAPYSITLSDPEKFVGRNNACLQGQLHVQLEEMLLGKEEHDSRLKHYVTSPIIDVEEKYKSQWQAENRLFITITSNKRSAVRVTEHSRRFAIYEVADRFRGEQAAREDYFGKLWAELEGGGLEALAYDLLNEDLEGFSPARVPKTGIFLELAGMDADRDPLRGWWRELLEKGELPEAATKDRGWTAPLLKRSLYDNYVGWCERDGPQSKRATLSCAEWAKQLSKMIPGGLVSKRIMREGKREHFAHLPDYEGCCRHFEGMFDCKLDRAPQPAQLKSVM